MAEKISFRQKRRDAPQWIFRWGSAGEPFLPKLLAVGVVALGFSLVFTGVKVRVGGANASSVMERKASWIMEIPGGGEGDWFSWIAMQDGPFPSRWDPVAWNPTLGDGPGKLTALDWSPPRYEPTVSNLAETGFPGSGKLAVGGETVFPKPQPVPSTSVATSVPPKLRPMLRPLGGESVPVLPLPAWNHPVEPKLYGANGRFLIRTDGQGNVAEVISMADVQDSPTMLDLAAWLRRCRFAASATGMDGQWLAVMIEFVAAQTDGSQP
jgi:hypothetical protein